MNSYESYAGGAPLEAKGPRCPTCRSPDPTKLWPGCFDYPGLGSGADRWHGPTKYRNLMEPRDRDGRYVARDKEG